MKLRHFLSTLILLLAPFVANAAAYTFRAAGAEDYDTNAGTLTPGAPAGKASGDLLLLLTVQRVTGQTVSAMTGWDELSFDNTDGFSYGVYCRVADGGANDTPSVVWTGTTADMYAVILAYHGDVHACSGITDALDDAGNQANEDSVLRLPSLDVVANDSMVVVFSFRYKTTTSNDATTITPPASFTLRESHIQAGNGAMMVCIASWQQTTSTDFDGSDCTRDGTNETVLSTGLAISLLTDAGAAAPTFDTSPTVASETGSAYTINYDADANAANIFVGAYKLDSATPTCDNIEAGTGTGFVDNDTEATTGASDSIVLTITAGTPFPAYDIYACLEGTGGDSSVVSLVDEFLDPAAGKQFVVIDVPCGGGVESILDGASPAAVDGDIIVTDTHVDSFDLGADAHVLTMSACGAPTVNPGVDDSQLTFTATFYDVSVGDYSDAYPGILFAINNGIPELNNPNLDFLFPVGTLILPVALDTLWVDPESDTMVFNINDLPAGLSEDGTDLTGTPTACGAFTNAEFQATDEFGDTGTAFVPIYIGALVPDVTDTSEAAAITAIEAEEAAAGCLLTAVAGASQYDAVIAAGNVIETDPAAGTAVPHDQEVTYILSLGPTPSFSGADDPVIRMNNRAPRAPRVK